MINPEQTVALLIAGGILVVCISIYYIWLLSDTRKKQRKLREEVDELKRFK